MITYKRFGNTMHIDHWYNSPALREDDPVLRNSDDYGKTIILARQISKKTGRPFWFLPAIKIEFRPAERLCMNTKLDNALFLVNGKYPTKFNGNIAIEAEKFAKKKPAKDYRIEIIKAFEGLVYQRQGIKKWILIEVTKGYA